MVVFYSLGFGALTLFGSVYSSYAFVLQCETLGCFSILAVFMLLQTCRKGTCLDSWSHICTFCNFYLVVFTAPHLTVLSRTINIFFICIFFALRGWFLFLASKPIAAQSLEIFNREVTLADCSHLLVILVPLSLES